MKKILLQLRQHFLAFFVSKKQKHSPKTSQRVFNIQEKIQQKANTVTNKPKTIHLPAIPVAQITIQTVQIPMVSPSTIQKAAHSSLPHIPKSIIERQKTNVIRKPLSEKDIANLSEVLKSFHGNDVRDLF